jgi:hypothetical protein
MLAGRVLPFPDDDLFGSDDSIEAPYCRAGGLAGTAVFGFDAARCWSDGGFMFLLIPDQYLLNDIGNLLPHAFHRVGIDVDTLDRFGRLGQTNFLLQLVGKVIRHAMQTQPRLNEVMMNRVQANLPQGIDKSRQSFWREPRRQHYDVGGAEEKGLMRCFRTLVWILMQKFIDDFDHSSTQAINRRKLSHVYAG